MPRDGKYIVADSPEVGLTQVAWDSKGLWKMGTVRYPLFVLSALTPHLLFCYFELFARVQL